MAWGTIDRVASLLIPFICRTAIIQIFGINYLGLNSLFTSILSTLNLAELGFGSAVVFFMYRTIAEEDVTKTNALLNFIKTVFRIVGTVVLVAGLLLLPFLKYLIKADIPAEINIYTIYLLTLASTVLSYYLLSYKTSIFRAHQRTDIIFKISTIVTVTEKILQLVFIFICKNYYLYIAATLIACFINNTLVYIASRRQYPQYTASGKLPKAEQKELFAKVRGLFMYKIGNVVSSSADSIVISAFLGLSIMGKYGNYYYVITTLMGFLGVYYNSIRAGIGNSIVTDSLDKNYRDFKTFQLLQNWLVSWCAICLFCLLQNFITLYAGKDNLLPFGYTVCLCLYFWIWKIQDIVYTFKEASGLWSQDRYRPLIGAGVNLCLNVILVQFIGLYGVILSTVLASLIIDLPWAPRVLFKEYFGFSPKGYYKMLLVGFVQMLIMLLPTYLLCRLICLESVFLQLCIKAVICLVIPNTLFIAMNFRKAEFGSIMRKIKGILKI